MKKIDKSRDWHDARLGLVRARVTCFTCSMLDKIYLPKACRSHIRLVALQISTLEPYKDSRLSYSCRLLWWIQRLQQQQSNNNRARFGSP